MEKRRQCSNCAKLIYDIGENTEPLPIDSVRCKTNWTPTGIITRSRTICFGCKYKGRIDIKSCY